MVKLLDPRVALILRRRDLLRGVPNDEITRRANQLKWLAQGGRPLRRLLVDSYALASEATRRVTGKSHYPVQVHAGIRMFQGRIAQMQTGEGKTISAVLPVVLRALSGRGCHVLTANEYLATRDAQELKGIYQLLGLTLALVRADMDDKARAEAYGQDVTYTTAGEVGFDFLRDCMKRGTPDGNHRRASATRPVHREFHFALVDEADSILIDDARTPLIIGSERSGDQDKEELCRWAYGFSKALEVNVHYLLNPQRRSVDLSEYGCRHLLLSSKPPALTVFDNEEIFQHVERALVAQHFYLRDRDYIVMEDDSVAIVDEGSGRVMEERKWQQGLHQAIEAKEGVVFSPSNATAAKVTLQTLFRKYEHLAGMTGTVYTARNELKSIYKIRTCVIPTNRDCIRKKYPTRIFLTQRAKHREIVSSIQSIVQDGRAVLVGTPSVEASEVLSAQLRAQDLEHAVLNCRAHGREAEIIAQAGQPRAVTISTNMAGRGTDILLHDDVRAAGGLHVIATERHSSARIDRQLVGRCARQGDPGSFQFMLSMEDELFRAIKPDFYQRLKKASAAAADAGGELPRSTDRTFKRIQKAIERQHARSRRQLLKQEKERLKSFNKMSIDPFVELLDE